MNLIFDALRYDQRNGGEKGEKIIIGWPRILDSIPLIHTYTRTKIFEKLSSRNDAASVHVAEQLSTLSLFILPCELNL